MCNGIHVFFCFFCLNDFLQSETTLKCCMHMQTDTHTHVYDRICVYNCVYINVHTHISDVYDCICICICICILYAYVHVHVHAHAHVHYSTVHTYVYIYILYHISVCVHMHWNTSQPEYRRHDSFWSFYGSKSQQVALARLSSPPDLHLEPKVCLRTRPPEREAVSESNGGGSWLPGCRAHALWPASDWMRIRSILSDGWVDNWLIDKMCYWRVT
jgi:hypothetical protein